MSTLVQPSAVPCDRGGMGIHDVHANLLLSMHKLEYDPHFKGKTSIYLQLASNPTSRLHQASDLNVGFQGKQLELPELKAGSYVV